MSVLTEPLAQDTAPWELYTERDRKTFLLVLFLVSASSYVDKNIIGVLLEQIKAEFHATDTMLGLLSGISFALFYATFGIPLASWADRGNRKRVILVCLSVWSIMTALCGLAGNFWQLAAARFGVGAGEAGSMPPAQSLLADYYPPTERAGAIGVLMMSSAAGYAVGLVLGGFIAQHYGWRDAFFLVGLLGIVLAPLTQLVLKEPRLAPRFAHSSRNPEPMLATIRALLAKPAYCTILGSIIIYFLMGYGALVFIVSILIRLHGLNVAQAGATFGTISAVGAVAGNLIGGSLADRLATRNLASIARLAGWTMIAAIPLYELALGASSLPWMVAWLLLAYVVLTAVMPPMFAALHVVCGSSRRAMAVAFAFFLANLIGLGTGPVLTGALSDHLSVVHGAAEGLRGALMIVMTVLMPGGLLMLHAAKYMHIDAED